MNTLKLKILLLSLVILATVGIVSATTSVSAEGTAVFRGGDILTGGDRSAPTCDWCDPVSAGPGHAIEFRVVAQNTVPDTTANNVKVTANLPEASQNSPLTGSATVSADNAASVSDTLTVNFGNEMQGFAYIPGHARIFSPSCPSGCTAPDTVTSGGVNIGNLNFGESAQVLWKTYVTNREQPTPTPTPTPTPSPTPAPTATPTPTATPAPTTTPAPQGNTQSQSQTQTNNQNVTVNNPAGVGYVGVPAPQVAGVYYGTKQLPKTGLPLLAWAAGAFIPAGFGLKRFGSSKEKSAESANYLWEEKQFKTKS